MEAEDQEVVASPGSGSGGVVIDCDGIDTMKLRKIIIKLTSGYQREVEALITGPFGIHLKDDPFPDLPGRNHKAYVLTHIKTGYSVKQHIFKKQAILLANRLKDLDWNFTEISDPKLQAISKIIKPIFEEVLTKKEAPCKSRVI